MHDGPFYAVLDADARVHKNHSTAKAHFDPFQGQPTYSQRYMRQKNALPKLGSRPFVKDLFPRELWTVIEPGSANGQAKKKSLHLSTRSSKQLADFLKGQDEEDADPENAPAPAVDEDDEQEDPDQFDEDDEDDNDDYNAENYFDDGEGDDDMGDDGGDGGEY